MVRVVFVLALIVALTGSAWAEDPRVKLALTQYRVRVEIIREAQATAIRAATKAAVNELWAAVVVRDSVLLKLRQAAARARKRPPKAKPKAKRIEKPAKAKAKAKPKRKK